MSVYKFDANFGEQEGEVTVTTHEPDRVLEVVTAWASEIGVRLEGLEVERPSLEEVYLKLVQHQRFGGENDHEAGGNG